VRRYPSIWRAAEAITKELDGDVSGECYDASLAVYILVGRRGSGLKLFGTERPEPHYWLRGPRDEFIDLTAGQFDKPGDFYVTGKREAFPKRMPRSATLMAKRARRFLSTEPRG
jgi:hypothetical protein